MNVGWSVTMSAEKELSRVRTQFVWRVSDEVLAQLLEALVSDGVLNDGEKESIREENQVRLDKARRVIDTVRTKGDEACRKMIRHLQTIDPRLSSQLGLSSGPSSQSGIRITQRQFLPSVHRLSWSSRRSHRSELWRVRTQFVQRVSDEVLAQLLKALLSDGVLEYWAKESMLEDPRTTREKARYLINTVRRKGINAWRIMIKHLQTRDPLLSSELGLSSAPSSPSVSVSGHHKSRDPSTSSELDLSSRVFYDAELWRVRTQFVWRVSDEVLTQLIDDLVSDGVLDDKDKKAITKRAKAEHVIYTVLHKGDKACRTMIRHLQTIDPLLSSQLGFSSAPSSPSGDSQVKLDPEAAATKMMEVMQVMEVMEVIEPPSCFTPAVQTESEQVSYRFSFPGPGQFQCSLTGLVFDMTREAKLQYRIIQWDESVLTPTGKTPAGPLFDIKGPEDAVRQLHFPHCETKEALHSGSFLSVIHFSDDGTSVLKPLEITDTHVVVEVPHLSAFGVVWNIIKYLWKIRGQILLFLRKPNAEANTEYADMLLLPRNVPLLEVKAQHPNSDSIPVASNCELIKDETYTVHCETAMKIQPKEAKFDMEFGPNYHATFVIDFALNTEEATITVQDQRNTEVWKHDIDLTAVPRSPLVSSSNLQELHQSGDSLERTPPGPAQRSVLLKQDDRCQLLSILKDLNDEDFKDFMWYLKNVSWNNKSIQEDQLSKAERRDVVDLMLQTYEITGAVQVMETILEKIRRNDLVEKLRAELCTERRSLSSV